MGSGHRAHPPVRWLPPANPLSPLQQRWRATPASEAAPSLWTHLVQTTLRWAWRCHAHLAGSHDPPPTNDPPERGFCLTRLPLVAGNHMRTAVRADPPPWVLDHVATDVARMETVADQSRARWRARRATGGTIAGTSRVEHCFISTLVQLHPGSTRRVCPARLGSHSPATSSPAGRAVRVPRAGAASPAHGRPDHL